MDSKKGRPPARPLKGVVNPPNVWRNSVQVVRKGKAGTNVDGSFFEFPPFFGLIDPLARDIQGNRDKYHSHEERDANDEYKDKIAHGFISIQNVVTNRS